MEIESCTPHRRGETRHIEDKVKEAQLADTSGRPAKLFSTIRDLARNTWPERRNDCQAARRHDGQDASPSPAALVCAVCRAMLQLWLFQRLGMNRSCELKRMTRQGLTMIPFMRPSLHSRGNKETSEDLMQNEVLTARSNPRRDSASKCTQAAGGACAPVQWKGGMTKEIPENMGSSSNTKGDLPSVNNGESSTPTQCAENSCRVP